MLVKHSIEIAAPADKVWQVVSGEFGDSFKKWAVGVVSSETIVTEGEASLKTKDGSTGRKVSTDGKNEIIENLVEYSDESMQFKYSVEGLFGFILEMHTNWQVTKTSESESALSLELTATMNTFPGMIMDPVFTYLVGPGVLKGLCESAKHYAETGEPSPAKKKELEKTQK